MNSDGIFISRTEIQNKFRIRIPYLKYYQIVSSIKSVLTKTPKIISGFTEKDNKIQNLCLKNVQKVTSQQVYCQLVKKLYRIPTSQNKWIEYYPFLEQLNWKNIYLLPTKIVKNTNLISLQYKILHRVFKCNYKLFLWGVKDSSACIECNMTDNVEHYSYYCDTVKKFWDKIEIWVNNMFPVAVNFATLDILLGCQNPDKMYFYAINLILLYGKYFIHKCKLNNKSLSWDYFQIMLKNFLSIDKFSYISQGQDKVFNDKFGILVEKL